MLHLNIPPVPLADVEAAEVGQGKSRFAALGIAALLHALLFVMMAWIVTSVFEEAKVELVVEASRTTKRPTVKMEEFTDRVTKSKPSAPTDMATKTIVAIRTSPLSIPQADINSAMVGFGSDLGTGFGNGSFGEGQGDGIFNTIGGGDRIILVIDTSTSMNGNCGVDGIEALRKEIDKTVGALSPQTRFNLICFGNDADAFSPEPVPASAENIASAKVWMMGYFLNKEFVRTRTSKYGDKGRDAKGVAYTPISTDSIKALRGTSGNSRMDLALIAAFKQKPSSVFLIADGEPGTAKRGKRLDAKQIVDLVEDEAEDIYRPHRLPRVNTISVKGIGEAILKDIAKRFKGTYKSVDPAKI